MGESNEVTRRRFLQGAASLAGLGLLSACDLGTTSTPTSVVQGDASPTTGASLGTGATPTTGAPAGQTTANLTYWHPRSHTDAAAEEAYWRGVISRFEAANPGTKVEWVPQSWADVYKKWVTAIESGQVPNVTTSGTEACIQFAKQGAVLPVDDAVESLGGKDSFSLAPEYYTWNNHIWGVPYNEGAELLFYRKDLLEEAGFSKAPANWDELLAAAKALTTGDRYGLDVYYSKSSWTLQHIMCFMKGADGGILGKDGKPMLIDPKNVEAFRYYTSLLTEHKVVPPSRVGDTDWNATTVPAYGAGKVAMFVYFPIAAASIKKNFPDIWEKTGVVPIPKGPSGHSGSFGITNSLFIFAKSSNQEAAKKFIAFIQGKEAVLDRARMTRFLSGGKPGLGWIQEDSELSKDPVIQAQIEQMPTIVRVGFPFGAHPANGTVEGTLILAETIQEIVVNNTPIETAIANTQKRLEELYA